MVENHYYKTTKQSENKSRVISKSSMSQGNNNINIEKINHDLKKFQDMDQRSDNKASVHSQP